MLSIIELKQFTPFNRIADSYLMELLQHVSIKNFSKGQRLYRRGSVVQEQFYLLAGHVDLINSHYAVESVQEGMQRAAKALNVSSKPSQSAVVMSANVKVFCIETATLNRIAALAKSAANEEIERATLDTGFLRPLLKVETADDWMSSLFLSPLFARISLPQVKQLFLRFKDVEYKQAETVMHEGERGDYFYVIASGEVRITNSIETLNLTLGPGQYFGEEALLGNTLRNATVTMDRDGCLKRLSAADFMALLKSAVVRYVELDSLQNLDKPYRLLDVKMPFEFRGDHLPGCFNLPLSRLRNSISQLDPSNIYVVPDDAGGRSEIAVYLLCQAGFEAFVLRNEFEEAL